MYMVMNMENLIESILCVGRGMVVSGTDVRKVEDSLCRMFKAYGIHIADIFVSNTVAGATVKTQDGKIYTQIKRIKATRTDLYRYEDFNSLSRHIVTDTPTFEEINKEIENIYINSQNNNYYDMFGCIVGTMSFCIFFGGSFMDGVASGFVGFCIYLMNRYLRSRSTNKVIYTLFASIMSGTLAYLMVKIGIGSRIDKIIIGDIMLFIPGLVILNAVKDMFYGDIIAGMFAFIESIIIAGAIVVGFAVPSYLFGGIF